MASRHWTEKAIVELIKERTGSRSSGAGVSNSRTRTVTYSFDPRAEEDDDA